jgi:hypothetical protein
MKKQIKGFERYAVDDTGVVYSMTGQPLKQRLSANGYLRVGLRTGATEYEKPTTCHIHRLVAEHFVKRADSNMQVNHIDGNKLNNHASNLEWVTGSDNIKHAIKSGLLALRPERMHADAARIKNRESHNTCEYRAKMRQINNECSNTVPVAQFDFSGNRIQEYENCAVAALALFGTATTTQDRLISRCARGKAKSAYGYKWRYAQEVAL